jgi:hypothetical protein
VVWPQNHRDGFIRFALKTSGDGFLRFGLKSGGGGFHRFGLKTGGDVFFGLALKLVAQVFRFGHQNLQLRFGDLGIKITVTVSWFGHQNYASYDLSVAPQKRWEDGVGVGHMSRFNCLLHMKASRVRVFQSGLKTGRGATVDGARGTITEVT